MNEPLRQYFNSQFSEEKYQRFMADLNSAYSYVIPFRVAETPVFIDRSFKKLLLNAGEEVIGSLMQPGFAARMDAAIPEALRVPNETPYPLFLALDFAVCKNPAGETIPQLIELQGFPSLFGYQDFLGNRFRQHYHIPAGWHFHFGIASDEYWRLLQRAIVQHHDPENVILLEIEPFKQNTAIDFLVMRDKLGIEPVHLGDVKIRNSKLFYQKNGKEIPVYRIYNRVIFDELLAKKDLVADFRLTEAVDVSWAGHPNWFFKISKYTMPFLLGDAVPECRFLSDYTVPPDDLENYVLKPLFSFSGSGVVFHVTPADIEAIPWADRKNFLLQRKVHYHPVVAAPDGMVKVEIRLLYLWNDVARRPQLLTNLARLSRGEMIGVKYNQNKTWVGGTLCFFEEG
jgi:hypothetical protein